MLVTLEPDSTVKLHQLQSWSTTFTKLDRQKLLDIATNPSKNVENINERITAVGALRQILEKDGQQASLTDDEVKKLFTLIRDEEDFPILVDPEEIVVEKVTHEQGHEDQASKKRIKKDIEENVAQLKADAALLIAEFGQNTNKFRELHEQIITVITSILGQMLGEPDHLFVQERNAGDKLEIKATDYYTGFVEALYCIKPESAKVFMDIPNPRILIDSFSVSRRARLALKN